MYFPVALPSISMPEGAALLVNTSQQIVDPDCKWVTRELEVKYEVEARHDAEQKCEQIPLDMDELFYTPLSNSPSKLYFVKTDEFEIEDSNWKKVASTPGIYVFGERLDGFYEVVVDESYIPLLLHHNFQFLDKAEFELLISSDSTQPAQIEVDVYGIWEARGRFHFRFLENAFKAIWSRRSRGLKLCLRSIAPPYLETALEWAILSCDILESNPLVQGKLTLSLVLLALSLLDDYNTPLAMQLLEKDQDGVLQAFRKDSVDIFNDAFAEYPRRTIELVRRLLIHAGGPEDPYQFELDQEHTTVDNLNLLGSLVNVTGSHHLRNFDLHSILSALSRSKAITTDCIDALGIAELISQLTTLLPTGFQSSLGHPAEVPLKTSLCFEQRTPPGTCPLRVPFLRDGVYELGEGFSDRKLRKGDVVKLRLGGILTGYTSRLLVGDDKVYAPSALEDGRLMTLFGDYDGCYEDHKGIPQHLSKEVLRVVKTMKVGQKVLIVEEEADRSSEENEDRTKETRIWVVQILQVCAGHLGFGQNVPPIERF